MTVRHGRRQAISRSCALALGVLFLTVAGCGDNPAGMVFGGALATVTSTGLTVYSATISPALASVAPGGTVQFTAIPRDAKGNVLSGKIFCGWSSDWPAVATVSGGLAKGVSAGTARIKAGCGGLVATAYLMVTAPKTAPSPTLAASVSVSPTSASVAVGATQQLTATASDSAGNVLTSRPVTWSSSAPAVASVTSTGIVTGLTAGSARVSAVVDGKVASSAITVTTSATVLAASVAVTPATVALGAGGTQQLTATARDVAGNVLAGRPVTWSSSAPAVASVSSTGLVTAVAGGSASITATVDGKSASVAVSVSVPVSSPSTYPALIFSDDFENGFAPLQNGAGWQGTNVTNVSISSDVAHSGSHSLKFQFPGKPDCLDNSAEQRFWLGAKMQEVWLEWYIYYPAGGEGGSAPYYHRWQYNVCQSPNNVDNNKFLALWGPTYQKEPTLMMQTWTTTLAMTVPPKAPGDSRIQTAATTAGGGGAAPGYADYMNFVSGAGDRGRWMQIRLHARVADFGVNNGVVQMWKDGVMILSNTTLPWYDSSNTANYLMQGYLLGWADSGFAQTTNIYIDDFKIIGQNPGW